MVSTCENWTDGVWVAGGESGWPPPFNALFLGSLELSQSEAGAIWNVPVGSLYSGGSFSFGCATSETAPEK